MPRVETLFVEQQYIGIPKQEMKACLEVESITACNNLLMTTPSLLLCTFKAALQFDTIIPQVYPVAIFHV